tara:strand:- start:16 stop:690 length:675 start_codon:yes stop_codon:yes gene_type:complete
MINIWKPNPKNTGTACRFWINRDNAIMGSLIKQASWDDRKKKGFFQQNKEDPDKNVIIRFSQKEIADIINVLVRSTEFSTYHRSPKQILQIRFTPWLNNEEEAEVIGNLNGNAKISNEKATLEGTVVGAITKNIKKQRGFSLSVSKQDPEDSTKKISFLIGFDFGEGTLLKTFLEECLRKTFVFQVFENDANSPYKNKKKEAYKPKPKNETPPPEESQDDEEIW